jgi:hypothetical protein
MPESSEQVNEYFQDEPTSETPPFELIEQPVTDRDIFKLAKYVLLSCLCIYIIIGFLRIYLEDNKGAAEVWEYSKIILNSITSLVLGLYFGKKAK